ncbi:DNA-binding protein [Luteimonas mephitis]|uniref:DNA-binding protein n=1 Tax=Luteimonas mephitis TaxID=83615 RepID=UPI003A8D9E94
MARGITEKDVHTAADALVAEGERPTVERIRAYLGTGSPNTVVRWLETWWKSLGERLQAHESRLDLPEAPEAVTALAGKWWGMALELAKSAAHDDIASERGSIEAARLKLHRDREEFNEETAALRQREATALQARDVALARTDELERLVRRLEGQVDELTALRDAVESRVVTSEDRSKELERQIQALQEHTASDRDIFARHIKATEDRAHAEVDRARQESHELKQQLAMLRQERAAENAVSRSRMDEIRHETTEALREAAVERAKADILESQLMQLRDLLAALDSAREQVRTKAKSRTAAKRNVQAPKRKKQQASARKS